MQTKKASQIFPKNNVADWKLTTAIAALVADKISVPAIPSQLNGNLQLGAEVSEETVLSAYLVCCAGDKSLQKQIDRLGFLRYELLNLLELMKDSESDAVTVQGIIDALNIVPKTERECIQCEVFLRQAIHRLMPDEEQIAKVNLYSKALRIKKGELSNHVFHLVKLGRSLLAAKDRQLIEKLIGNQLVLLSVLADNMHTFGKPLEKKILKAAHWQPKDLETAKSIYNETCVFLETYAPSDFDIAELAFEAECNEIISRNDTLNLAVAPDAPAVVSVPEVEVLEEACA